MARQKYAKFEEHLNRFFHSNYYILLMAALTLWGWVTDNGDMSRGIMVSLSIIMFCICKNTIPFFAFQWFFIFAGHSSFYGINISGWRIVFPILLLIAIMFNSIRFKPDFKGALSKNSIKGSTLSIILLIIPMTLGGLTYPVRNINAVVVASVIFIGIAFAYVYYMGVSKKNIIDKDSVMKYMIKLMFLLGVIVSIEMIVNFIKFDISYLGVTGLEYAQSVYLYWGGSNHIGAMLGLCISSNFYYMFKNRRTGFLFIIITFIELGLMIWTKSRGSLLFTAMTFPVLIIYTLIKAEKKIPLIITATVLTAITFSAIYFSKNALMDMINRIMEEGFDDTGRFELWAHGLELFKEYPIFGAGWDYGVSYPDFGLSPMGLHSMFIQVMACSGIIGIVFFGYYYWARYTTFLKKFTDETIIVLAGMFVLEAYGMIDHISFLPPTYFVMLLLLSFAMEQSMPEDKCRPLLLKRLKWSKKAIKPQKTT